MDWQSEYHHPRHAAAVAARWHRLPRWARLVLKVAGWAGGACAGLVLLAALAVASHFHP